MRLDVSGRPIVRLELDLDGDGEPAVAVTFPVGVGFDGRYIRALAVKFTVNGIWDLLVRAVDDLGRIGITRCSAVTVTF